MKNPFSEKVLFLQVKNKDHDAYGRFYDLYVDRVYRFVFFKVNSVEDAKDLTSEVFLKTWQYIKDDKKIKNLNAFVYMVARNCVIDFYRSRAKKNENEEFVSEAHYNIIDNKQIAKQIGRDLELSGVIKALSELKDEYREAVILHYLDELSAKEIAQILDKTPGAVRVLIFRAMNALKEAVNQK